MANTCRKTSVREGKSKMQKSAKSVRKSRPSVGKYTELQSPKKGGGGPEVNSSVKE